MILGVQAFKHISQCLFEVGEFVGSIILNVSSVFTAQPFLPQNSPFYH